MCTDGDLRFSGPNSDKYSGRVEVCIGKTWGSVCDEQWDSVDAYVACKQSDVDFIGKLKKCLLLISSIIVFIFLRLRNVLLGSKISDCIVSYINIQHICELKLRSSFASLICQPICYTLLLQKRAVT